MKIDLNNIEEKEAIQKIIECVPFVRNSTQAVRYSLSEIAKKLSEKVCADGGVSSHVSKWSEVK